MKKHYMLFAIAGLPVLLATLAFGQGLDFSGRSGLPAGIDIAGTWYPQPFQDAGLITASGALVDYGGIPLNEAGRLYSLAWNPSRIQGRHHAAENGLRSARTAVDRS